MAQIPPCPSSRLCYYPNDSFEKLLWGAIKTYHRTSPKFVDKKVYCALYKCYPNVKKANRDRAYSETKAAGKIPAKPTRTAAALEAGTDPPPPAVAPPPQPAMMLVPQLNAASLGPPSLSIHLVPVASPAPTPSVQLGMSSAQTTQQGTAMIPSAASDRNGERQSAATSSTLSLRRLHDDESPDRRQGSNSQSMNRQWEVESENLRRLSTHHGPRR